MIWKKLHSKIMITMFLRPRGDRAPGGGGIKSGCGTKSMDFLLDNLASGWHANSTSKWLANLVGNRGKMWCRMIKFPSVVLRPATSWVGGGVNVSKRGVHVSGAHFNGVFTRTTNGIT